MPELFRDKAEQYAVTAGQSAVLARRNKGHAEESVRRYQSMAKNPYLDARAIELYTALADAADQVAAWYEEIEYKADSLAEHLRKTDVIDRIVAP